MSDESEFVSIPNAGRVRSSDLPASPTLGLHVMAKPDRATQVVAFHVLRSATTPENASAEPGDRELEVLTSFALTPEMAENFGRTLVQMSMMRRAATRPRNSPCPCGSGKKYKLCHGRPGA